jgi:hypothetical protein
MPRRVTCTIPGCYATAVNDRGLRAHIGRSHKKIDFYTAAHNHRMQYEDIYNRNRDEAPTYGIDDDYDQPFNDIPNIPLLESLPTLEEAIQPFNLQQFWLLSSCQSKNAVKILQGSNDEVLLEILLTSILGYRSPQFRF